MLKKKRSLAKPRESHEKEQFKLAEFPTHHIYAVHSLNNINLSDVLKPHKISVMFWRVLGILQEKDGMNISYLAGRLSIDKSNLSRTLDAMVKQGLVAREAAGHDRRNVLLCLTKTGRRIVDQAYPDVAALIGDTMDGFSEEESRTFLNLLQRMKENSLRIRG
jgi:DNA-binding MarR family transcriptional regulator